MGALGVDSTLLVDKVASYEILGELGARPLPVRVARHVPAGGRASLVVVERFEGVMRGDREDGVAFFRRARRIATLAHPNLAHVREVSLSGEDLLVAGAFVDGEKLAQFWSFDGEALPLEVALRVLIGVLTGLGALHRLCDAKQQPLHVAHGEIAPGTVLFGIDGIARVLNAVARQAPGAEPETGSLGYLAPEVQARQPYDERADVFGVGVLLWEILSGCRLSDGPIPPASVPENASWARGLVDVAAKALELAPADRWATAAEMAAQIHQVAGPKVASVSTAAAWIGAAAGERVRERRTKLEGAGTPDDSQSVMLPRSSSRIAGANSLPSGGSGPHAGTLPWAQVIDAASLLGERRKSNNEDAGAAPSESKVQFRSWAPGPAAVAGTPAVSHFESIESSDQGSPSTIPPPLGRVPWRWKNNRSRVRLVAAWAAGAIAFALVGLLGAHRLSRAASPVQGQAALEMAPSVSSGASSAEVDVFAVPRMVPRAQPEGSGVTSKASPSKRAPNHPARPKALPRGSKQSP
jgi:serine/threonine-protein kinase